MRIRHELKYAASPPEVYAMLSDPAFRERVCQALNAVSADVAITPQGEGMTVRIDMVQRTSAVPGFAKKVVGDQTRVVQHELWSDAGGADLDLEIPGKPGSIRGRITLSGDSSATVETFEGEVKTGVPLIGGRLEELIGKLFIKGMDAEHRLGTDWLAEER